jgi:hypothetical protein
MVPQPFRHLSLSVVPKRNYLAIIVTVSLAYPEKKSLIFSDLCTPETMSGSD